MMTPTALLDFDAETANFAEEALQGLTQTPKTLPCKFFYDAHGSHLFDRICVLDEYYPTRTEMGIMQAHAHEMSALLGDHCRLVEYGSGSSLKTRVLLDHAQRLASYVPIDISREHLERTAQKLAQAYPHLPILPVCADYTQPFSLPQEGAGRTVVYFPGSTVGNFAAEQARDFLARIAQVCGPGGGLLIGVDLKKPAAVLNAAYNDQEGVTAAFNLNLLVRMNRELGADFALAQWAHRAFYNSAEGRIEMHLVSRCPQTVTLGGRGIAFGAGETIHTESSYKYAVDEFAALAERAGFEVQQVWTDSGHLFSVQYLSVAYRGYFKTQV